MWDEEREEAEGGGRIRAHKKYKNKCKSPKAATTEGTINCYMEADELALNRY